MAGTDQGERDDSGKRGPGALIAAVILIAVGVLFFLQNRGYPIPTNLWSLVLLVPAGFALSGLWRRYQAAVHHDHDDSPPARFMLEDGGVPGGELQARDPSGRLLAVALCDVVEDAWSSVYCYYDPDCPERGLGTFMALAEIDAAASRGLRWWYPGFWVAGCAKMAYKARFGPTEVLRGGCWSPMDAGDRQT